MDIWWDITDDFGMMGFISWDIVNVILEVNLRRKKTITKNVLVSKKNVKWFMIFGPFSFKQATGNICQTWLVPCSFRGCGFYFSFTFRYRSGGLSRLGFFWGSVTIFHRKRLLKIRCDIFMGYKNHGIVLPSGNLLHSYWKWLFVVDFPINSMVIFHSYVGLPKGRIPKGIPLDSMYSWNAGSLTVFCETHCTRHPKVFQTYMPVEIKRCCCCLYPSHFFGANLVGLHLPLFWCCWHFLSQLIQASIVIHRQLHRCFWSKSRRNPFPR
jgi:hypothetical protein